MTKAQECIREYLQQKYGSNVVIKPIEKDRIEATDKEGNSMMLTMTLFGDIMDAETGKMYAVSDLSHDLRDIGEQLPHKWIDIIDNQTVF